MEKNQKPVKYTVKEERFVLAYLSHGNATKAYRDAGYAGSDSTCAAEGSKLLNKPKIVARLQQERAVITEELRIDPKQVLEKIWHIGMTDRNELSQMRRGACRYCHGEDHKFQRTHGEYESDHRHWQVQLKKRPQDAGEFEVRGGAGFNPRRKPHEDCPNCFGEGEEYVFLPDSRDLSNGARACYAGAKHTKYGIEVMTHDATAALSMIGKNLGLFNDNVVINFGAEFAGRMQRARERAKQQKGGKK